MLQDGACTLVDRRATGGLPDAGWALIKDENGTVTVLKNLLPSPVCAMPNGAKYIGYATGSKFIANLIKILQFKFVEWHPSSLRIALTHSPST